MDAMCFVMMIMLMYRPAVQCDTLYKFNRTLLMTISAHVKLGGQGKGAMSTLMTVIHHLV